MNARLTRRFGVVLVALLAGCATQPNGESVSQNTLGPNGLSTKHTQLAGRTDKSSLVALAHGGDMAVREDDADDLNDIASNTDSDADGALSHAAPIAADTPDVSGFHQTGKASWYGEGFHGRRTASGEVYDMNEMTAAHRSLPLMSYIRVTNVQNNKSVIVKVNDRGPFHGRRILDLSMAAAKMLGMTHRGTEKVSITGLSPNEARAALADPVLASR